jgi:hypothetical protein
VRDDNAATDEDTSVEIDVLANDQPGLTLMAVEQPGFGVAEVDSGLVVYTPDPDAYGTDTFTYTACDVGGECAEATVTVVVAPVDGDRPVAVDDWAEYVELFRLDFAWIDVLENDTDPDGDLRQGTLRIVEPLPTHGRAFVFLNHILYVNDEPTDFDFVTYEVCDATELCDTALVTIDLR